TNEFLTDDIMKVRRDVLGIPDKDSDAVSVNMNMEEALSAPGAETTSSDSMPEGSRPEAPPLLVKDVETGEMIPITQLQGVVDRTALDMVAKSGGRIDHLDRVTTVKEESPLGTFLRKEVVVVAPPEKKKGLFSKLKKKIGRPESTLSITSVISGSKSST